MPEPIDWSSVSEQMLETLSEQMLYLVWMDARGRWFWRLVMPDGKLVAICPEDGFQDKASCLSGISLAKRSRYTDIEEVF